MSNHEYLAGMWRSSAGWVALCIISAGMFAGGYGMAMIGRAQARADAIEKATDGYRAAISAKDELIARLAGSAVKAVNTANAAAATASSAAATASDAAATANQAAGQSAQDAKALRKIK